MNEETQYPFSLSLYQSRGGDETQSDMSRTCLAHTRCKSRGPWNGPQKGTPQPEGMWLIDSTRQFEQKGRDASFLGCVGEHHLLVIIWTIFDTSFADLHSFN